MSANEEIGPESTPAVRIEPGGRLHHYELLEQIGEGGMATIFKGRDLRSGRIVAVKVLHAHQQQSLAGKRFLREFRAIQSLQHPHIVQVYEYEVYQGQPYIAMEYVKGQDLKATLKDLAKLPLELRWRRTIVVLQQTLMALEFIHRTGIIHRDLKPSNILLNEEGVVKLTDFGVAKSTDASQQITTAGMLVGTLAYLAPEVFEQGQLDHRVDLYALGVMLYVMLTGKLPFSGKNIVQIMQKHLKHEPDPPSRLNPDVPVYLSEITMRLLEKRAADRYQSAAEVLRVLERACGPETGEAPDLIAVRSKEYVWKPDLVGRADEVARIKQAVESLAHDSGGLLVVTGPDGVGKSYLVEVGLRQAALHGINVSGGQCYAGEQDPYEGFRSVLRVLKLETTRTGGAPEALDRLIALLDLSPRPLPDTSRALGGTEIDDLFVALFRGLSFKSPLVVWIDDVERAEPYTVNAIITICRQVTRLGGPLLLVLSGEEPGPEADEGLRRIFAGQRLVAEPVKIVLERLTRDDVGTLLERLLPADPRVDVLADRLFEECGGDALHLNELLRLLMLRGKLTRRQLQGEVRWGMTLSASEIQSQLVFPVGVDAVIRERLTSLAAQTRTLLRLIAVWGRDIGVGTLLRLITAPEDALLQHLRKLESDGWIDEAWLDGEAYYWLTQPRYRRIMLEELNLAERKRLRTFIELRLK